MILFDIKYDEREEDLYFRKCKISFNGPDTIVYIPRTLIKHKVLSPEKRYNIHFEEILEEELEKKD